MSATTTARGYGYEHQRLRRRWAVVERGEAVCAAPRGFRPSSGGRRPARKMVSVLSAWTLSREMLLKCEECANRSQDGRGWIAEIVDDVREAEVEPYVVYYCPACSAREFGWKRRTPH
jgi:hypothetical protein